MNAACGNATPSGEFEQLELPDHDEERQDRHGDRKEQSEREEGVDGLPAPEREPRDHERGERRGGQHEERRQDRDQRAVRELPPEGLGPEDALVVVHDPRAREPDRVARQLRGIAEAAEDRVGDRDDDHRQDDERDEVEADAGDPLRGTRAISHLAPIAVVPSMSRRSTQRW